MAEQPAGQPSYVDQWVLDCVREESFERERSVDDAEAAFCSGPREHARRNLEPLAENESVLSPGVGSPGVGDAAYDEIHFAHRAAVAPAPASVPRLSLNNFGAKEGDEREPFDAPFLSARSQGVEAEDCSDGPTSRDESATEGDSRPVTARSRTSSRDGTGSREGSRDSRRTHRSDGQSDGQPLSARSQGWDHRERQPLSARGFGGSDGCGSDVSGDTGPLSARTNSGDLCPRGLPQFSPRFLSPRVEPSPRGAGRGLGGGRFAVTSAGPGPRSILSPRVQSHCEVQGGPGPWGVGGGAGAGVAPFQSINSPRQRQSEPVAVTLSLAQHKDLDNAARRVAYLEELLQKAQEENAQLQANLVSARGDVAKNGQGGSVGDAQQELQEEPAGEEEPTETEGKGGGEAIPSDAEATIGAVNEANVGDRAGDECKMQRTTRAIGFRGNLDEGQEFARKWVIGADDLRKVRCIGRGAAGAVYEGRWCGSAVAIKELEIDLTADITQAPQNPIQAEILLAFRHEVSRMAFLRHPNVVAFYGIVWQPPALALVTELAAGDLRGFINACSAESSGAAGEVGVVGSPSSLPRRVKAGYEACAGLLYLHEETPPIVHRDVKPENFLVSAGGEIKVCDFGLARDLHQTRMHTEHMGGSLLYIAPEVHRGQHFDTGCDVYAMALIAWELLTLQRPFHEFQEHMLPGLVGWGAQRPSLTQLLEMVESKKDSAEGAALSTLVHAVEAAWTQQPDARPGLEELHGALATAHAVLSEDNVRHKASGCVTGGERIAQEPVRVMF